MTGSRKSFRFVVLGLLAAAAVAFAPASFARGRHHDHWNVSLGFGLPGLSVGYSNHGGYGYVGGGYYGGYSSYYAPAYYGYGPSYYGPSYYGASYYGPSYYRYSAPVVYRTTYYDRPVHRSYRSHDRAYYDGGRGYGNDRGYRRATYYDRGYR